MPNEIAFWKTIKILSIIGIGLASYLFYNYLAYNIFSLPPLEVCNISSTINCNASVKGDLATFLGIPVSLFGFVGYFLILYSAVTRNKKLLLGMSAFGVLFCLRITILEIFFVRVYCPVCLACQAIMLVIFGLAVRLNYFPSKKEASV
jgi:uncharacterized membrane protein